LSQKFWCKPKDLSALFLLLKEAGFTLFGPRVEVGAIGIGVIQQPEDLPVGLTEQQSAGRYRLRKRGDGAYFGFTVGPTGWRRQLHLPKEKLFSAQKQEGRWQVTASEEKPSPKAFIGVRACDWKSILIQDLVFKEGDFCDQSYSARRENLFVVGVDCVVSAPTCFCTSFDCGPEVSGGVDLALTEVLNSGNHYFVVRAGTSQGQKILHKWQLSEAKEESVAEAKQLVEDNRRRVKGNPQVELEGLKQALYDSWNHLHWEEVGKRCLACSNCTLVCPTCFCSTTVDQVELEGDRVERFRQWESCFNSEHGYLHGGGVRPDITSRYRQWLSHKLASWQDQFGTPGCTGCGRCVVWCPVGIDLRQEISLLKESGEKP